MQISLMDNIRELLPALDDAQREQLPFATALAITRTGEAVRKHYAETVLPQTFTIRTAWPRARRFLFSTRANKRDLKTEVVFAAPWLYSHFEGEIRTPRGTFFAVPSPAIPRTAKGRIKAYWRPRAIMSRKGFMIPLPDAGLIALRKRGGPPIVKYYLAPLAEIRRLPPLQEESRRITDAVFPDYFREALDRALATAKA